MVRNPSPLLRTIRCFPHPRGDGPRRMPMPNLSGRFSPPAWGWSELLHPRPDLLHVFPTRVGMVRRACSPHPPANRFPHPRGDGPLRRARDLTSTPFSPPAWGWSGSAFGSNVGSFVFPTRVGMVRSVFASTQSQRRFPHPRGDGPEENRDIQTEMLFSPPAWGWSAGAPDGGGHGWVFPTRVGMVRERASDRSRAGGFPHPRGDGPISMVAQSRG